MSNLIPFQFDDKEVRVVLIEGAPFFSARDVAVALGYENPSEAYNGHCKCLKKLSYRESLDLNFDSPNTRGEYVIPESDMFRLILSSRLPSAERFESWVMEEVLPSIRKTGSYSAPQLTPSQLATSELKAQVEAFEFLGAPLHYAQIEAVKYVRVTTGVDYSVALTYAPAQNNIPKPETMLEPTELGRRHGMSAVALNRLLADHGYQRKEGKVWEPTELGRSYCEKHAWSKKAKSGYNLKWRVDLVDTLLAEVAA